MKTLIVVDVQNDFVNRSWGNLYVPDGEKVIQPIIEYIENNTDIIREVIFTLDWHPYKSVAFTEPEITWPKHCLQYSEGAAIPQEIINTCVDHNLRTNFFIKGNSKYEQHTEYGAFEKIGTYAYANGDLGIAVNNRLNNYSNLILPPDDEFVVCGVAGDYCVMNTIKNFLKYLCPCAPLYISVMKNGIASIDGGEKFDNFVRENNLKTV